MTDNASRVTRKGRTAMSCERCKLRKTKCSNPVPGPCDLCRAAELACHVDVGKRRQRPYYFVSEEEYRHMQRILKHYLPNTDLTPATLRLIASQCEEPHRVEDTQCSPVPGTLASRVPWDGRTTNLASVDQEENLGLQEIIALHEDLGCMLADARGQYRYVGADSGISFNSAVRTLKTTSPQADHGENVIPGLETVRMPVAGAMNTPLSQLLRQYQHPPKELLQQHVARYFAQVHCRHWLYSSEQFHARLQASYNNTAGTPRSSWLCSLYCIFTLGALSSPSSNEIPECQSADANLEMAKSLMPQVCDEADLDSVRALFLLVLALQSSGFTNSAYLYMSVAVRIAFSLGLHVDKYSCPNDPVQKEHARRIWWSLYIYDQELALRVGKPCMIGIQGEESWNPPMPSEEVLSPGPYTPPGYLQLFISLTQIVKSARHRLYVEPISGGRKLTLADFETHLASLREWSANVPPYLKHDSPCPPLHKRSVCMLHVHYWIAVIFVSRPFLLCILLRRTKLQETSSLARFETIGSVCIHAAEESLNILQKMVREDLLSSALVSDFYYTLDLLQVFLVAYSLNKSEKHLDHTKDSLEVLKAMSSSGLCEKLLPEVLNQLRNWGVIRNANANPSEGQEFDMSFGEAGLDDDFYDMLFSTNPVIDYGSNSMHAFHSITSDELIRQVMGLTDTPAIHYLLT